MYPVDSIRSYARIAAGLLLAMPLLLAGCENNLTAAPPSSNAVFVPGNWQISSTAAAASHLPQLSGELSGTSAAITGVVHSDSTSACVPPTSPIAITGSASPKALVTLTGQNVAGGTLTITGTLAADGKSLSAASYNVTGGTCAFAQPAVAVAQQYSPISGNYTGTFSDADGPLITIQATLNQSPDADGDGNYTLSGSAIVPSNPCFPTTVPVSNTQVTGGSFTFTFTTSDASNTVVANGTFNNDASVLTVQQWTSSGTCGADSGTGSMSQ